MITVCFADPPYPGQARKRYRRREVSHAALVRYLAAEYPDGWALSTGSNSLAEVLAVCPAGVRVGAWVKPFASFKPGVNPGYCWEPVIFAGGRNGRSRGRRARTVRDFVSCNVTLRRGFCGAKPEGFCFWLFDLLGLRPGDVFVDLFRGSGAVTRAWEKWQREYRG